MVDSTNSKKLKMMVVDDEVDNLDLLYRTFRRKFTVYRAEGALEALELLGQEGEMAIIISDQRMPHMNGTEFFGKVVEQFPDTIRILLTGYTDVDDLVNAINSGKVFKYITKPWKPEQLNSVVEQALETYLFSKQRTEQLRLILKQKELFNRITNTIRQSLDYDFTCNAIVSTIAENFEALTGLIIPVKNKQLTAQTYCAGEELDVQQLNLPIKNAIDRFEAITFDGAQGHFFIQPLGLNKELISAVLVLHYPEDYGWPGLNLELLTSVTEQAAIAISQAELYQRTEYQATTMRSELEVARQIQQNLLRHQWETPAKIIVQAQCEAAKAVGGDFYEVYTSPQGDVWIALGDVSGKGVPAALFMASALSLLRWELTQAQNAEPQQVMEKLNVGMADNLFTSDRFITMVIARYRPSTGELVFANAGHVYPLLWGPGEQTQNYELICLKDRGIPIGILEQWRGDIGKVILKPGDTFLLTSDGLTEATTSDGTMINATGLWQLIGQQTQPLNISDLLSKFRNMTTVTLEDDQTLVCLHRSE
jgi:serine phosphatase RsbU (regulator of sigma subunit)/CheY-like chemotaxis protein